jgi:aminopeptidase N
MRIFCRKSLEKHTAPITKEWFSLSRQGIAYFEQTFSTPFPFDKLDSVFCPDYRQTAMENVGCITYDDTMIPRGEPLTLRNLHHCYVIVLHEISHMWFGNLVTTRWWDNLWLQEAFANMISYKAMYELYSG